MGSKALKVFASVAFVLCVTVVGNADCRQFFRQQFSYQAVIAQPVVLYQAGVGVEQDALAERIAQRVEARIMQRMQGPQQLSQQQATGPQTALGQHCSKCHSGATPKAGLLVDGSSPIDCRDITAALRAIAADKMPKDHKLTPEQKGAVMQQLLDLEREEVPPAPDQATGELK